MFHLPFARFSTPLLSALLASACASGATAQSNPPRIIAWNDLGMHCIDPDFSVFSILPPFNTVNSQLILNGKLQVAGNYKITWEGVADATGSINTSSIGKTNFWQHVMALYGVNPPPDVGLSGSRMPGPQNTPQPLHFDANWSWYQVEGFPMTPFDDRMQMNPYPLIKVTARDANNAVVASTVTVAPNSQELDCSRCHQSGANPYSRPTAGWVFDPDPLKDNRLNILRLHDERELPTAKYKAALAKAGYNSAGLLATVQKDKTAVLCATCHATNALPGTGQAGISPLTQAIHGRHAYVLDTNGEWLTNNSTRSACYTCHPGYDTQCLRGAMGKAIGEDGEFSMQCQSCHGSMMDVASPTRTGWLDQPTCQNCHSGTATQNSGAIRYTSVFDSLGQRRQAANPVFATTADVPSKGFSLYRFSEGHGGLQCAACHGPPHAIYPTNFANDNVQSVAVQGHEGTIADCSSCHGSVPEKTLKGPHGMHPITQKWVKDNHGDVAKKSLAQCRACHGKDDRGTVLSLALGDRLINTKFGVKDFWKGSRIGCYNCHKGPHDDGRINNKPAAVPSRSVSTPNDLPAPLTLTGVDPDSDPLTFRIVSQPKHGTVALKSGTTQAVYRANSGYIGSDSFTYAAWDGKTDSNLGTVTVNVGAASCKGSISSYGFGCIGSAGAMPLLSADGCPTPGSSITVSMKNGFGGGNAFLLFGANRARIMAADGCVLRIAPLLLASPPILLKGSGAGAGNFDLTIPIPVGTPAGMVTMQAVSTDQFSRRGWGASNGIEVKIR